MATRAFAVAAIVALLLFFATALARPTRLPTNWLAASLTLLAGQLALKSHG